MAWVYLVVASLFEIFWTFSLKFMNVKRLRTISWHSFFFRRENWEILAPFACYVIFVSMAMKQIPASTALAVWMGLTLLGAKLAEIYFFKQPSDVYQFIYMSLILAGIVGLKQTN